MEEDIFIIEVIVHIAQISYSILTFQLENLFSF